jgi:1-deoxy-D-xylulose-5-phosphate reductoisomerase
VPVERLDLAEIGQLSFRPADPRRWPALRLAREVMAAGGLSGAVFNAAKEVALDAFLDRRIRFTDMAPVVEETLARMPEAAAAAAGFDLDLVMQADHMARVRAAEAIEGREN